MVRFRLLGGIDLRDANGNELRRVLAQPKRLALLAYLAISSRRSVCRRDTITALFWPKLDQERARNALNKAVHFLRQSLGNDVLVSRTAEELEVPADKLWCDVVAFEGAAETQDHETATELYKGELLPGLFVEDARPFEEWVDAERANVRAVAASAARSLAERYEAAGKLTAAITCARRGVELSVADERALRELLELLGRLGDRAGALHAYERFVQHLASEYGAEPAAETKAVIEQLRARSDAITSPPAEALPESRDSSTSVNVSAGQYALAPTQARLRLTRTRTVIAALIVMALLIAGRALIFDRSQRNGQPAASYRIAVFPFAVRASAQESYLGEALMDLLNVAIDGVGELRRADPFAIMSNVRLSDSTAVVRLDVARRVSAQLGAGRLVMGTVTDLGGRLTVSVAMYEVRRRAPVREVTEVGTRDSLQHLIHRLALGILAGVSPGMGLPDLATTITDNADALKAYLEGESLIRQGRYEAAAPKLMKATDLDSSFALAWLRQSLVAGWGVSTRGVNVKQRVRHHLNRLPGRERALFEAESAQESGDWARAEPAMLELTRRYPDEPDAWTSLAYLRAVHNWAQGRSAASAREALERALSLKTPPAPELVNLAINVAVTDRQTKGLRDLLPLAIKDANGGELAEGARVFVAFADGDPNARDTLRLVMETGAKDAPLWVGNMLDKGTDSLDAANEAWSLHRDRSNADVGSFYVAANYLARGRWRDGRIEFARVKRSILPVAVPAWFAALPFFDRPKAELLSLRDSLRRLTLPDSQLGMYAIGLGIRPELNPWAREYIVGLLSARLDDRRDALKRAQALAGALIPPDSIGLRRELALEIRALLALNDGDDAEALRFLEQQSMRLDWWWTVNSVFHRRMFGRFLRAELLARTGRSDEALGWFSTFAGPFWGYESILFAPAYLRIGELHERAGNTREASIYYRRFVARWRDADQEYQALVRDVQQRISRLTRRNS